MKMLLVHQVERTQHKECIGWSIPVPTVVAALRTARWPRLPPMPQHSWAAGPRLLQCPGPGACLAMAEITAAVGRARAPHIQFGASPPCSVFCTTVNWSHSLEPEHFLFSEQGHVPTFCIITKGKEYVLHLAGFFYT